MTHSLKYIGITRDAPIDVATRIIALLNKIAPKGVA